MDCFVDKVLAPNGKPSILFKDLLLNNSVEEALPLYLSMVTEGTALEVDENGEPVMPIGVRDDLSQVVYSPLPLGHFVKLPPPEDTVQSTLKSILKHIDIKIKYATSKGNKIEADAWRSLETKVEQSKDMSPVASFVANRLTTAYAKLVEDKSIFNIHEAKQVIDLASTMIEANNTSNEPVLHKDNTTLTQEDYQSMSRALNLLRAEYGKASNEYAVSLIKKEVDPSAHNLFIDVNGNFKPIEDINMLRRLFTDVTKSTSIINQLAGLMGLRTSDEATQETTAKLMQLEELRKLAEDEEGFDEDLLKEFTEDGKFTGRLVSKYSKDSKDTFNALRVTASKPKATDKSKLALADYMVENTIISLTSKTAQARKVKFEEQINLLKDLYTPEELQDFINRHDPIILMEAIAKYKMPSSRADESALADFISKFNLSYIDIYLTDEHLDDKYKVIQAMPATRAYYDAYRELKRENDFKLGGGLGETDVFGKYVDPNNIYQIPKLLSEQISENGLVATMSKEVREALLDAVSNKKVGGGLWVDPLTGKNVYGFFKPHQKKLLKKDIATKGYDKNLSQDLTHTIVAQTLIANEFSRNVELEPILNIISDVQKKTPIISNKAIAPNENSNANQQLDYYIRSRLFGQVRTDQYLDTDTAILTDEEKIKQETLKATIADLQELKAKGTITAKEVVLLSSLEEQLYSLGSRRLSYGAFLDTLNEWCRRVGLSGNIVGSVTDLIYGFISLSNDSPFGLKAATKGYALATTAISSDSKLSKLTSKFNVELGAVETLYTSQNIGNSFVDKYLNKDSFYATQQIAGAINAKAMTYAYLSNTAVDGTRRDTWTTPKKSLWESFDEEGNWIDGEDPFKVEAVIGEKYIANKLLSSISLDITSQLKKVQGNFDPKTPMEVKKEVWGRLLMVFKSFYPNQIDSRFAHLRYDIISKEMVEGRYVSMFKEGGFLRDSNGKFVKDRILNNLAQAINIGTFDESTKLDELTIKNVRKNLREVLFIGATTTAYLVLAGMKADLDDEEEDSNVLNYLLNQNNRVLKDLSFYYYPPNTLDVFKNPIPMLSTVNSLFDVVGATGTFIFGKEGLGLTDEQDTYERGSEKGNSKLFKKTKKIIPYAAAFDRNWNTLKEIQKSR